MLRTPIQKYDMPCSVCKQIIDSEEGVFYTTSPYKPDAEKVFMCWQCFFEKFGPGRKTVHLTHSITEDHVLNHYYKSHTLFRVEYDPNLVKVVFDEGGEVSFILIEGEETE